VPRNAASRRTVSLHVAVIVVVPGCLALTWWQVERALSGNTLSWVYSFEWPFFAGYALYMWWRLTHEAPQGTPAEPAQTERARSGPDEGERERERRDDGELQDERDRQDEHALAEYNRYLAALHASGRRKHW
jgi:hypothetical protein